MNHSATISFDTAQTKLGVSLASPGIAPSISGEYLKVHLPKGANPAKTVIACAPSDVPVEIELYFDQPDRRCLVEALLTAGASTYDVTARAQIGQAPMETASGKTGAAIPISLDW